MSQSLTLIQEYINFHNKYVKQYGPSTIVLMQVGKFYEMYSTNDCGPDLLTISKQSNVMRSQKKKSVSVIDMDNPYFLGFPTVTLCKYVEILIEFYTIVVVDQEQKDDEKINNRVSRVVSAIYSKGTYIENSEQKDTKYIICIYLIDEKQKDGSILMCAGMAAIDLSTSKVHVHEAYSSLVDAQYALDEAFRFINSFGYKEIIIYHKQQNNTIDKSDDILSMLELDKFVCRYTNVIDNKVFKLSFQNEFLNKIYPNDTSFIGPIEHLDLEHKTYAIVGLILLIEFIWDKNNNLLRNLSKPIHYADNTHMVLGNNAIAQLNIISSGDNNRFKSLFHVLNKTSTAMGERYLKAILASPLTNTDEITNIYTMTDELLVNKLWLNIETNLDMIKDIEKLERKCGLGMLKPSELSMLVNSYTYVKNIIDTITNKQPQIKTILPEQSIIKKIAKMIKCVNGTFEMNELDKYTTLEFKTCIFKEGVHEDIDNLKESIDHGHNLMDTLRFKLIECIGNTGGKPTGITLKNNNKEGYYLSLTNLKAKKLQEKLKQMDEIQVGNKKINPNILIFKEIGNNTKIFFGKMDKKADDIDEYIYKLNSLTKQHYLAFLKEFYDVYSNVFNVCCSFITQVDYIKSCAKVASLYNYVKPVIKKNNNNDGHVNAKQLRHAIVERIIDYEYIPHDINIGHLDMKGMLIYGLNSSGKSVMMKSIGISIIMAQCGMFVPATSFIYYPYNALYTRISGNDNIFKGLSSFALEMVELNSILKRSDPRTLVIGDEVCRGTEHISGNALVATTIIKLAKTQSTFIFATHLHDISTLDEITSLKSVKSFHLKVEYDVKNDKLIYNRCLTEGAGEKVYGITVARHIIHDIDFIDTAMTIKNKLLKQYDSIMPNKTSKYNREMYVHECHVCKKQNEVCHISPLETHHINYQMDCKDGFSKNKPHIGTNQQANLIVLCNECHDKIHNGKLIIDGYVMTSAGKSVVVHELDNDTNKKIKSKSGSK